MKIEKLFKRLKREYIKVNFIQAGLDSILAFLLFNMVFFFTNIEIINNSLHFKLITGATTIFFLLNMVYRSKKYNIMLYEEKNPELKEILRTARDNMDAENVASEAMFEDLMQRAKNVESDSIIPGKEIIQKIAVIGVLSFLTVLSGITDFQAQKETQEIFSQLQNEEIFEEPETILKNGSKILGEEKDIQSTSTDLEINIKGQSQTESTNPLEAPDERELFYEKTNTKLSEDIQLAKEYSKAIKQTD